MKLSGRRDSILVEMQLMLCDLSYFKIPEVRNNLRGSCTSKSVTMVFVETLFNLRVGNVDNPGIDNIHIKYNFQDCRQLSKG